MREEAEMQAQLGLSPRLGGDGGARDDDRGLERIEEGENENEGTP